MNEVAEPGCRPAWAAGECAFGLFFFFPDYSSSIAPRVAIAERPRRRLSRGRMASRGVRGLAIVCVGSAVIIGWVHHWQVQERQAPAAQPIHPTVGVQPSHRVPDAHRRCARPFGWTSRGSAGNIALLPSFLSSQRAVACASVVATVSRLACCPYFCALPNSARDKRKSHLVSSLSRCAALYRARDAPAARALTRPPGRATTPSQQTERPRHVPIHAIRLDVRATYR